MQNIPSKFTDVPERLTQEELEKSAGRFHITAAWVAAIFDPVFAITDYINIPQGWSVLLIIRLCVSAITILTIVIHRKLVFSSFIIAFVPFSLISLQNAFTYTYIDSDGLLGQNLNYMALIVGASMFVLWHWRYSLFVILLSTAATALFVNANPDLTPNAFFLRGGLLLMVSAVFMILLIRTRFNLTLREIKARLALRASYEEIQHQAEEIKRINENLESLVRERTASLERKNKALEEYAFINAHKLRSPVASILGLVNILSKMDLKDETQNINNHLKETTERLDLIVSDITRAIEKGDE
ncbi:MAG: hypothetical protein KDC99_07280 [Cyclobacteriaceae bacterium]|nr:hypothetical protein [Cyclobacteriaceae bacterium]